MQKLKIAYFGSPDFSADFLEKILTDKDLSKIISVDLVVTQPDKRAGRKQILTPTPVKQLSQRDYLDFLEIKNLKDEKSQEFKNLKLKIKNFDLAFVYAYSAIIPKSFLKLPTYGFWCLHPSLLPKYRGPSPIAFALLNGEKETGITIFKMDEKIDHGLIIAQKSLTIKKTDYRPDLERKLTNLGFKLFKKICVTFKRSLKSYTLNLMPQDKKKASYTRLLKKEDGFIPFETLKKIVNNQPLEFEELPKIIKTIYQNKKTFNFELLIFNFFRALSPWPGVWTILPNKKRLKITQMKIENKEIKIIQVQLEAKNPVDLKTFNQAYKFF